MKNIFFVSLGLATGTLVLQIIFIYINGVAFTEITFLAIISFLMLWILSRLEARAAEKLRASRIF
ncbi:MAG: hypothetical protein ABW044_12865 [Cellvibrio sp.]